MKASFKVPHNLVIIFSIILLAAILTWIIPGGEYQRTTVNVNGVDRSVIMNGSFHHTASHPQTWQVFSAFYSGFVNMSHIIVFILMIGGAFWIMNDTRSIDIGIFAFLRSSRKLERFRLIRWLGVNNIIISLIMIMFSLFGAVFGMSEETIAFAVIFVPLSISMGFDSLVGVGLCYFAAHIGFAAAILNPFTIGIAQGLASVPLFTGIEYRLFCWVVITAVSVAFVLWYASRLKKDPKRSPMYEEDAYWRQKASGEPEEVKYHTPRAAWYVGIITGAVQLVYAILFPMTTLTIGLSRVAAPILPVFTILYFMLAYYSLRKSVHFYILTVLLFTILYLVIGVLGYEWYIREIASLFLAMGIVTGFAAGKSPGAITRLFVDGVKDIVSAALVVGFAGGIVVILTNGQIIDTVLHSLSNSLQGASKMASMTIMYGFQSLLNLVITSGSAKAALTIPIMAGFSDIIGISRQATIMAFQLGAGFTDMIAPTSGVLIGVIGMARIPYARWLKWVFPFLLFVMLLGWLLLIPTVTMKLSGF